MEDNITQEKRRGLLEFRFDDNKSINVTNIKVIGVGGGGCNAVSYMYDQTGELPGVSYLLCNTDIQALNASSVIDKIVLGPNITRGLGAGNQPQVAEAAAKESTKDIEDNLKSYNTDMTIITAGMGGGTGTGAAAVIGKISRDLDILTVGIVTIPFKFEGRKKILQALKGVENFKKNVDAILIINNQRLIDMFPDLTLAEGFKKSDQVLSDATSSICNITARTGVVNLDFRDIQSTIKNGGVSVINTGYSSAGENRLKKAIEDALNSPLLNNNNILNAKNVLVNLYCVNSKPGEFSMDELNYMSSLSTTFDKINSKDFIWGWGYSDSLQEGEVAVTILASGFDLETIVKDLDVEVQTEEDKLIGSYYKDVDNSNITQPLILSITELDDDNILQHIETISLGRNIANIEEIRTSTKSDEHHKHTEDIKLEIESFVNKIQ